MDPRLAIAAEVIDAEIVRLLARVEELRAGRAVLVSLAGPPPAAEELAEAAASAELDRSAVPASQAEPPAPRPKIERAPPGSPEPTATSKAGRMLAFIRQNPGTTRRAMAEALGVSQAHAAAEVARFRFKKLIRVEGTPHAQTLHPALDSTEAEPGHAPAPDVAPARQDAPRPARRLLVVPEVIAPPRPAPTAKPPVARVDLGRRTIKVEMITAREDMFRCAPLSATISAGTCVDRQQKANGTAGGIGKEARDVRAAANACAVCAKCALGKEVAGRVREGERQREVAS